MRMLLAAVCAAEILSGPYRAEMVRVIDGDTFVARIAVWPTLTAETAIRLRGIDTPELHGPDKARGQAARQRLLDLLSAGDIQLRDVGSDKYGNRLDASVSAAGQDVAEVLKREGWGKKQDEAERHREAFQK